MADENIKLDENLEDVINILKSTLKQCNSLERKSMNAGGNYIAQQVRKSYSEYFPNKPREHEKPFKDAKNLKRSIRKRQQRKPSLTVTIWSYVHAYNPYSPDQPKVLYGQAQAKGFTAVAKNDSYLTFQIDGKWVKKKQVTITPKPFVTQPGERAANSSEIQVKMEEAFMKEYDKIEKSNGKYKVTDK